MSDKNIWQARCEYPRGTERFVVDTNSKDQAYRIAEAFERDGFFNITVQRVSPLDDDRAGRTEIC